MKENKTQLVPPSFSRRKLLWGAGGAVAGLAVGAATEGIGPTDIIDSAQIAYEYGPDVAMAVVTHPERSFEAYRLWKRPEREYQKKPFFKERLIYRKDTPNAILGFGDSNLEGAEGDGSKWRQSPVHLFRTLAEKEYGFEGWEDFNCAKSGYTTKMVMDEQVTSQKALDGFDYSPRCDVWINAGGNDLSALVNNPKEVDELNSLADDPFNNMGLLLKYTERIEDNIDMFGDNFKKLLDSIYQPYFPRIRQFVIMSAPDFGKVNSIVTQEIEGQSYYISIGNKVVRRLIENISIRMNNAMFEAASIFQQETGARIVGLDTTSPQISDFSSNQHFSESACYEIATEALRRVDFAA